MHERVEVTAPTCTAWAEEALTGISSSSNTMLWGKLRATKHMRGLGQPHAHGFAGQTLHAMPAPYGQVYRPGLSWPSTANGSIGRSPGVVDEGHGLAGLDGHGRGHELQRTAVSAQLDGGVSVGCAQADNGGSVHWHTR